MKSWNEAVVADAVSEELRQQRIAKVREAIVAGILVLRDRDGLPVTPEVARERANNILTAILEEIS